MVKFVYVSTYVSHDGHADPDYGTYTNILP